jgi:hypothetical protein
MPLKILRMFLGYLWFNNMALKLLKTNWCISEVVLKSKHLLGHATNGILLSDISSVVTNN